MNNYILQYYQAIRDGSVVVGKWVRLVYEFIIKGLEEKAFYFDKKKADRAIKFIESFCHHHEGALAPQLLKLELWQKALVSCIFGLVDDTGARAFREFFLVVARKNGKTLLAAAIAEYCTFLDGEYGGRIYFAAPKLKQANLCFEAYHQMILQEPELDAMCQKRRTDIYIKSNNTTAEPLAFSAERSDGLNISVCVADEIASWKGDAGLKFYEVLKSSMGSRKQPLLLAMSTAGYINDSIYDELMKRSTRFLLGESKEQRLLPFLYMIDDIDRWNDITELSKANPNLGTSVTVNYLLDELAIAEGSLSKKIEFIVKYANLKQSSSLAWMPADIIEAACGERLEPEMFASSYCVAGIDLSQVVDLTCALVVVEKGGEFYVIAQFFLPANKIDEATARDFVPYDLYVKQGFLTLSGENFVDYRDVYNWFTTLVEKYELLPLVCGYDRYSAQYLVNDMERYGFVMDDVYQGDNLWSIIQSCEGLFRDRKIHIGDNALLKIHLLNTAIKMSAERGRGRIIKINANDHIDGCAALLDALTVREKHYEKIGDRLRNED